MYNTDVRLHQFFEYAGFEVLRHLRTLAGSWEDSNQIWSRDFTACEATKEMPAMMNSCIMLLDHPHLYKFSVEDILFIIWTTVALVKNDHRPCSLQVNVFQMHAKVIFDKHPVRDLKWSERRKANFAPLLATRIQQKNIASYQLQPPVISTMPLIDFNARKRTDNLKAEDHLHKGRFLEKTKRLLDPERNAIFIEEVLGKNQMKEDERKRTLESTRGNVSAQEGKNMFWKADNSAPTKAMDDERKISHVSQ